MLHGRLRRDHVSILAEKTLNLASYFPGDECTLYLNLELNCDDTVIISKRDA